LHQLLEGGTLAKVEAGCLGAHRVSCARWGRP
jgi:hypothetical protein